jgi:signal transduction histidine kinase
MTPSSNPVVFEALTEVHSPPGQGTRLTVRIPIPAMAAVTA